MQQSTSINETSVRELMSSVTNGDDPSSEMVGGYIDQHLIRFTRTLQATPRADGSGRLLDVGGLLNLVPCYQKLLGYKHITMTSASQDSAFVPPKLDMGGEDGGSLQLKYFDAEFDPFPFDEDTFDTVVCCEVIEHMTVDPMALMCELNRVCRPGGSIVLTTPNIISWKGLARMVAGEYPMAFSAFSAVNNDRHNREYTPREMKMMVENAGFDVSRLETFSQSGLQPAHRWLRWLIKPLSRYWELPGDDQRGDFILVSGIKAGAIRDRLPDWLYGQFEEDRDFLEKQGLFKSPDNANPRNTQMTRGKAMAGAETTGVD